MVIAHANPNGVLGPRIVAPSPKGNAGAASLAQPSAIARRHRPRELTAKFAEVETAD
jgi:hypothetical protein